MSAALAALFGIWCLRQYSFENQAAGVTAAVVSFGISGGLVAYDSWFLRKTRTLR